MLKTTEEAKTKLEEAKTQLEQTNAAQKAQLEATEEAKN